MVITCRRLLTTHCYRIYLSICWTPSWPWTMEPSIPASLIARCLPVCPTSSAVARRLAWRPRTDQLALAQLTRTTLDGLVVLRSSNIDHGVESRHGTATRPREPKENRCRRAVRVLDHAEALGYTSVSGRSPKNQLHAWKPGATHAAERRAPPRDSHDPCLACGDDSVIDAHMLTECCTQGNEQHAML